MKVKLLNKFENIMSKEEIANYKQFLLLLKYFLKSSAAYVSASGKGLTYSWEFSSD